MTALIGPAASTAPPDKGVSRSFSSAQSASVIGPTVDVTQRLVVTFYQIDAGGLLAGEVLLYFGDGAYVEGVNQPVFSGGFKPTASTEPGVISSKSGGWAGNPGEELRLTSGPIDPLKVTVWYDLIPAS